MYDVVQMFETRRSEAELELPICIVPVRTSHTAVHIQLTAVMYLLFP